MLLNKNKFFLWAELLYLLIPISLVLSKFLADFFLSLIVVFFILYTIKYRISKYYFNKIFIFFIIFCLYLIFNSLLINGEIPLSVFFLFRFGFFSIATWFLLDNNKNLLKYILFSIFLSSLLVTIDAFIQLNFETNLFGYKFDISQSDSRLSGLFKDELILGSYLTRFGPLVFLYFYLTIYLKKNNNNSLSTFLFIIYFNIYFILIIFSGERLSLIYFFLTVLFIFLFINLIKIRKIIIISLLFGCFFLSLKPPTRVIFSTEAQLKGSFEKKEDSYTLKKIEELPIAHIQHWRVAIQMIKNNFFFGIGPKKFRVKCNESEYYIKEGCANHPHNIYFQLFAEAGMIGFFFGIIAITFITYNIFFTKKKYKKTSTVNNKLIITKFTLFCLFLHFFPFLPNSDLLNNWINIIIFIPIGIYLHVSSVNKINV